ncbi:peptidoglycan recognition protein [Streptomyces sp. MST-110588]|uniref:peptidoglycan recognition protein family protein n=1 Tax=Streptomyces sp. MST-110588 TaxID=2833628 RepID=UPI001F5D4465|nr:peptidoglycan recognition protein [Streptomyces sp. MST-110588]
MRAFFASSLGVACTAALVLPLALPAGADAAGDAGAPAPGVTAPARPAASALPVVSALPAAPAAPAGLPGSTRSLPLVPLGPGVRGAVPGTRGLSARNTEPFSLVGVVWDDPGADLRGRVQVRTRASDTAVWSHWQDLQTHDEDAPDPDSAEGRGSAVRGSTAPLWVGASDAVQVRVSPEAGSPRAESLRAESPQGGSPQAGSPEAGSPDRAGSARSGGRARARAALPDGLRLELVDPGGAPPPAPAPDPRAGRTSERTLGRPADQGPAGTPAPAHTHGSWLFDHVAKTGAEALSDISGILGLPQSSHGPRDDGPRDDGPPTGSSSTGDGDPGRPQEQTGVRPPRIVSRAGWGADESLREKGYVYTGNIRAAFIHHSATGSNYRCSQSPSVIRSIYRYHVKSSGWRDLGYNFLVDKCGTVYEGRAGGVAKPVLGAHTLGFNANSMGIAVLGTYTRTSPPKAALNALARLTAWKLGLSNVDPRGATRLVSDGGTRYKKGAKVKMRVISGHRDAYATDCPGRRLYNKLGTVRSTAARYQGR